MAGNLRERLKVTQEQLEKRLKENPPVETGAPAQNLHSDRYGTAEIPGQNLQGNRYGAIRTTTQNLPSDRYGYGEHGEKNPDAKNEKPAANLHNDRYETAKTSSQNLHSDRYGIEEKPRQDLPGDRY